MDELPASVAMRRSLSGGLKTTSHAPFEVGNPPFEGGGGGFSSVEEALPRSAPPLEPCQHCGRTFAVESLKRHLEACRRHHESAARLTGGGGHHHGKLKSSFPSGDASGLTRLDTSKSYGGTERMGYD
ncbi:unnamed protein product [Phytomonas sp. EM1]|nr:unnamed protein product [Phytomonas sp. EM1]|eukprot:CCW59555.1 unnamed protein product [Phytomonas sp. isolate EM1]